MPPHLEFLQRLFREGRVTLRGKPVFSPPDRAEAITKAKQARVARLAQQYLAVRRLADRLCRFDVVLIRGDDPKTCSIELLTGAFELPLGAS